MGAVSMADSIEYIVNRDYRVRAVISSTSWEQLGISEPDLNLEEKSSITGISVEEYEKIAEKEAKAKQAKEDLIKNQEVLDTEYEEAKEEQKEEAKAPEESKEEAKAPEESNEEAKAPEESKEEVKAAEEPA